MGKKPQSHSIRRMERENSYELGIVFGPWIADVWELGSEAWDSVEMMMES